MSAPARRRALIAAILACALLTGCGSSNETNELFLITGISLDKGDEPGIINVALEAVRTGGDPGGGGKSGGEGGGKGSGSATLVLEGRRPTVADAIHSVNQNSSRKVFIHHNQAVLISADLAREGFENYLDMFVRSGESRMEVPVVIVEGKAAAVFDVELEQDKVSGMFVARVLDGAGDVSRYYEVRMLDLVSMLLDGTTSPVLPKLSVTSDEDEPAINMSGMAIFKHDKYVGDLTDRQALGYIWAMGGVRNSALLATCELGRAAFAVTKLECRRTIAFREDGGVNMALDISANLTLNDLVGFEDLSSEELMPHLKRIGQQEIVNRVVETFEIARALNTDIYELGADIHRYHPAVWKGMKDRWDEVFPMTDLSVRVEARVDSTGKVSQSLKMKEAQDDD